ncbi:MAG: sugar ABC transporter permease [Bifidobacteriaceae bacterium]|nr:sugar ABC transporter permease [Bifidobacteriaceae bacterium]
MVYPACYAFYLSFTRTKGLSTRWIWFENYTRLAADPVVHQVFLNNVKFLVSVPMVIAVALVTAVLLFEKIRGWRFFRVVFFIPNVLSAAVIGLLFRTVFGYNGLVNGLLGTFGAEPVEFLTKGKWAMGIIILALVWSGFGYQTLLLLSGLTAIPTAIYEAAILDGATWWQRLWRITLPNIRQTLGFVFIINVIYTFTALFGFVFVITAGGPGYDTTTIDYLVYLRAFSGSQMGSGAALAVVLFVIVGILTLIQARVFGLNGKDAV